MIFFFLFFKQMTSYELRISDWSADVCSSDLHALRLVDRRRIAMIEVAVILDVERDAAPVVGAHRHTLIADALDRPERAVLHFQAALVAQEHDAVAGCKHLVAALDIDRNIVAKVAATEPRIARCLVELATLRHGGGADTAAGIG